MIDVNWVVALNLALSFGGFGGWCYVWFVGRYQTGESIRTQIGIILLGFMWLSLILADTMQDLHPTSGTIIARLVIVIAFLLLLPLLHANDTKIDATEVKDSECHTAKQ